MKSCIMEWQNAGLRQLCEAVPGKFVFWQSGFCRWQQWPALPAAGFDGLEVCFWAVSYTHLTLPTILLVPASGQWKIGPDCAEGPVFLHHFVFAGGGDLDGALCQPADREIVLKKYNAKITTC